MNIKSITFSNFRSYGNVPTTMVFPTEGGNLIGVYGESGSGKSSICDIIDFSLFKKVKGKNKAWATLSTIPNRFNKNCKTEIVFEAEGNEYKIERSLTPSSLILYENGQEYPGGKNTYEEKIASLISIEIDTFKSFVSVNVNDFKNFVSLKPEEKRVMLDKLFCLDILTSIQKYCKTFKEQTNESYKENLLASENYLTQSLRLKSLAEQEKVSKIDKAKLELEKVKERGKKLKSEISLQEQQKSELTDNIQDLENKIHSFNNSIGKMKFELESMASSITNLNDDICPRCFNKIDESHREHHHSLIKSKGKEINLSKKKLEEEKNNLISALDDLKKQYTEVNNKLIGDIITIKELGTKVINLQEIISENDTSNLEQEYLFSLKLSNEKKANAQQILEDVKEWGLLTDLFSEYGIKKDFIASLVEPINIRLLEYIPLLNLRFKLKIDDNFNVLIEDASEEIDVDTLSSGEEARINIALLFSYLSIIHSRVRVNILWLDEVLKPLGPEDVAMALSFMKSWAITHKLNIIITHHSEIQNSIFDEIYYVERSIFSSLHKLL